MPVQACDESDAFHPAQISNPTDTVQDNGAASIRLLFRCRHALPVAMGENCLNRKGKHQTDREDRSTKQVVRVEGLPKAVKPETLTPDRSEAEVLRPGILTIR